MDKKKLSQEIESRRKWPHIEKKDIEAITSYLKKGEKLSLLDGGGIIHEFEKNFAKFHRIKKALSVNSGTSAIHSAFFAIGIKKGDEVIAPTNTYLATISPLLQMGAKPVFCDSQLETGNIEPKEIQKKITKKTKAVIITHLLGRPCAMDEITRLTKENNLFLIEDCSHAHGAKYKNKLVGTFGDIGCFSLQAHKIIPSGEGGILITKNTEFYQRALMLGHQRNRLEKQITLPTYKKFWDIGYGLGYRMHPLAAVLANNKLKTLLKTMQTRRKNGDYFTQQLSKTNALIPPSIKKEITRMGFYEYHVRYPKKIKGLSKQRLIQKLNKQGLYAKEIDIKPLHLSKMFQTPYDGLDFKKPNSNKKICHKGQFPASETRFKDSIKFPTFNQPAKDLIDVYAEKIEKTFN